MPFATNFNNCGLRISAINCTPRYTLWRTAVPYHLTETILGQSYNPSQNIYRDLWLDHNRLFGNNPKLSLFHPLPPSSNVVEMMIITSFWTISIISSSKTTLLGGGGEEMGGRSSFKIFFITALIFAMRWLPNSFGGFCWISLGSMHQTIYWHYVEVGENSSLTIFVNDCSFFKSP